MLRSSKEHPHSPQRWPPCQTGLFAAYTSSRCPRSLCRCYTLRPLPSSRTLLPEEGGNKLISTLAHQSFLISPVQCYTFATRRNCYWKSRVRRVWYHQPDWLFIPRLSIDNPYPQIRWTEETKEIPKTIEEEYGHAHSHNQIPQRIWMLQQREMKVIGKATEVARKSCESLFTFSET